MTEFKVGDLVTWREELLEEEERLETIIQHEKDFGNPPYEIVEVRTRAWGVELKHKGNKYWMSDFWFRKVE